MVSSHGNHAGPGLNSAKSRWPRHSFFCRGDARRRNLPSKQSAKKREIADLKEVAYAGDVNAQVHLGVIYLTGDGVAKDDVEAVKWLRKAADQDSPLAERYLAEMYFKGRGVPADNEEAAKWLRMAAEHDDAQSQYNLAVLYTQGQGVPRNLKEALNWMSKAAEQNLAAGEMGLGVAYGNGDGVPPDPVEAAKWYQKAVDQNYVPADEQSRHAPGDHHECRGAKSEAGHSSGDSRRSPAAIIRITSIRWPRRISPTARPTRPSKRKKRRWRAIRKTNRTRKRTRNTRQPRTRAAERLIFPGQTACGNTQSVSFRTPSFGVEVISPSGFNAKRKRDSSPRARFGMTTFSYCGTTSKTSQGESE